jgi:hypothetical protein
MGGKYKGFAKPAKILAVYVEKLRITFFKVVTSDIVKNFASQLKSVSFVRG